MPVNFRSTATAQNVAEVHKHLADAVQAMRMAVQVKGPGHVSALSLPTADALRRIEGRVVAALYSMETPFVARTDAGSPFASPGTPDLWLRWLAQREKQRITSNNERTAQ
ncbi:MAG: hypothetical protein IPL57_16680 [Rubrivivax sp.]|nr:hypothetical protein [Rubrivivax sp.]